MNRSINNNVGANCVRPCWTRRISRAVFVGFVTLSLALAVGCGDDEDDKGGGGDGNKGGGGSNTVYKVSDATLNGFHFNAEFLEKMPDIAQYGIGTLYEAYPSWKGEATLKYKDVPENALNTLVDYYKDNGGTVTKSTTTSYDLSFSWGIIGVRLSGTQIEVTAIFEM